jgi:Bacterial PH domain
MSRSGEEQIRDELEWGERLLWSGRPRQGLRLGFPSDAGLVVVVLFLLVWTGLVMNGLRNNIADDRPLSDVLIPIVMALAGLFALVLVLFLEPRTRSTSFYGLTDRRVFLIHGLFRRKVESLPLHKMTNVGLRERRDRSGTITFEDFSRWCGDEKCTPQFARIDDARRVYELIRDAQANLQAPRA